MKFKGFHYDGFFLSLAAVSAAALTALTAFRFGDKKFAVTEALIFTAVFVFGFVRMFSARFRYGRALSFAAKKLDYTDSKVLSTSPYPVALCNSEGKIIWANDLFRADISENLTQMTDIKSLLGNNFDIDFNNYALINDRYYLVNSVTFHKQGESYTAYKFIDNTDLKLTEFKYESGIPHVVLFQIDNIDDNPNLGRETEKTELQSIILGMIYDWCDRFNSTVKKISEDRLMTVTERSNINDMIADKFSALNSVRNYKYKEKNMQVTLSIGVSSGESIKDSEKNARKALETAINRGGDQAAILFEDGSYSFFGAVSKSADKKNKVKIKLWARQLSDEILAADRILISGHKSADFDSLGSAFGIAYACMYLGKEVNIIYDDKLSLAGDVADLIRESGNIDLIKSPDESAALVTPDTLFILTDTHVPHISDGAAAYDACSHRVIIDHHRLVPGTETDKFLFIHNPNASSACEIVTELLQHIIKEDRIDATVADALLAGIMLDTKEFVLRTSTVTFEVAAFLKSSGADTLKINKFFFNDAQTGKIINKVVLDSETYNGFAVSRVDNDIPKARLIASKAADELLRISGIKASFVLYEENGRACISARSFGDVNVQLIMEALGGGGHQTMAACQIKNADVDSAKEMLLSELDDIL